METAQAYIQLAARAQEEFDNLADFVWKAPRLVETERQLELSRLDQYFPHDAISRELRWKYESNKLDHVFPYLIAVGNLFALLSLFESYMLALCNRLESQTTITLKSISGNGVQRLFRFLQTLGIATDKAAFSEQVQAAIKIRNCLIHASGVLSWSRRGDDLREIQLTSVYLSPEHRGVRTEQGGEYVYLQQSSLGDRISVRNEYCHLLCAYLRDHFVELCEHAERAARV